MDNIPTSKGSILHGQNTWSDFDMWYTSRMESSFHGYVSNTRDALLLFEAAHRGLIPKSRRRLKEEESIYLRSGQVFIFDETESGIKRWTDGLLWSPSRVLSNFLVYRQVDKKQDGGAQEDQSFMQSTGPFTIGDTPAQPRLPGNDESQIVPVQVSSTGTAMLPNVSPTLSAWTDLTDYSVEPPALAEPPSQPTQYESAGRKTSEGLTASPRASVWSETQSERGLVGSLRGSHLFSKSGLCKKTISIPVDGTTLHLVAYFTIADVRAGFLATPSSLPRFASLPISPDIVATNTFRFPPKIIKAPNGTSMIVLDDDSDHGLQNQQEHQTPPRPATHITSYPGHIRERSDPTRLILSKSPSRASSAPLDTRMSHLYPTVIPENIIARHNTLMRLTSEQVEPVIAAHQPMQRSATGDPLPNHSNSNAANTHMQPLPHDTQIGHSTHRQPHMWLDNAAQWKPSGLTGPIRRNALVDNPQSFLVHPASSTTLLEPGYQTSYTNPGSSGQQEDPQPRHLLRTYDSQHQAASMQHEFLPPSGSSGMWTHYRDMGSAISPSFMHSSDMNSKQVPPPSHQLPEGIVGSHHARTYPAPPHLQPSSSLLSSTSQTSRMDQPVEAHMRHFMMSSMPAETAGRDASSGVWTQRPVALTDHAAAYYAESLSHTRGSTHASHEPPG